MSSGEQLWSPGRERVERSQMYQFLQRVAKQYQIEANYPALHRWSIERSDLFWGEILNYAEIAPLKPAASVRRGEGMLGTSWFPGMELNYAAHLLRWNDDQIAIIAENERTHYAGTAQAEAGGSERTVLTYRQLRSLVARMAAALRAAGVRRGDRVAGYVPNMPEAVIAMLAAAALGAVWSSCSPDFGVNGVVDRFGQIAPKVLVAADGYTYNGKPIDTLGKLAEIIQQLLSVEQVVVFPFLRDEADLSQLRFVRAEARCTLWDDFLCSAPEEELRFEALPFNHPLFIMFSSGTTGVPKCIVHGHGGTLLQHMKELQLHTDLRRGERIFYFTTCGWMMWNWMVSSLGVGATLVLYEGNPGYPDLHRLWRMSAELGLHVFGTSAKYIASCMGAAIHPGREHDLSALRCICSTGSPLSVDGFRWVYEEVQADVQLASICGGTDIISCFMLGNPMLPVYAGEIQSLGLGMDVQAWDENGQPVIGQKGELVCCRPFPSQPVCFWNDPDGAKYRDAYFEHYPNIWRHGDFVEITARGGVVVYGRSDATLNPGGVRIGTAEIYRLVESLPEVTDSLVVGRDVADDVEICLFVVLQPGHSLDATLEKKIRDQIAAGATRRHLPKHIRQVTAIPYTRSGKKVEMAVVQVLRGEEVRNRTALANPEVLDHYRHLIR
ncbi:MAG: Acetyl-coenzyme A synthetase [Phycisphaerae bacterium]|nr:Acetyl-coenzyme A synthetase [Phycisphaerae bacterium]